MKAITGVPELVTYLVFYERGRAARACHGGSGKKARPGEGKDGGAGACGFEG